MTGRPLEKRRSNYPILVPEASASGMIAVIRSLGRAGYPVHAVSSDIDATGLQSRYCRRAMVHPDYTDVEFIPWLRTYVRYHSIALIVPSEGFYLAIKPSYEEFEHLLAVSSASDVVYRCLSKADVQQQFAAAEQGSPILKHLPDAVVFEDSDVPLTIPDFEYPAFVKADAIYARSTGEGAVIKVASGADALTAVEELLLSYRKVILQAPVEGRKATVNICKVKGELLAHSMGLAAHESPHTGGLTSLRHTWWHPGMYADALARIDFLNWDGVAMVEYKWDDRRQKFNFVEINSRYWAALHLDLHAGTDFPRIQVDRLLDLGDRPSLDDLAKKRRTTARLIVPADFGHAVSKAKDAGVPLSQRAWAVLEFFLLCLVPTIKADYWFPGDRALYFRQWGLFLKKFFRD